MAVLQSAFDVVVRGGTVVDGSGGEPFRADVAIAGGRIARIGSIPQAGREEIDARDRIVTPGFVDIHTHYDGQVTWEERLQPSSLHGVTTAVMSNCAVGFAPCRTEHRELLIKLMEGIEDIPDAVMTEGIPWAWESFEEYLDFLAQRRCDIDFATQVPHAPVRVFVMGRRGADREPATAEDMHAMARIVQDAVRAGALGFTTSRTLNHRTKAGALAPTTTAAEEELRTIVLGLAEIGAGVLQMIDDFHGIGDDDAGAFAMWRRIVEASGRPLSFTLLEYRATPGSWRRLLDLVEAATAAGLPMKAQVSTRPIGSLFGLELSTHPFTLCPSYRAIADLALAERVALMRQPEFRARLLREEPEGLLRPEFRIAEEMFAFGDPPDYSPEPDQTLGARAARLGINALELAYDTLLERDGQAMLYLPTMNFAAYNLDSTREMMLHPDTVIGLGDGGAHVARICDASLPTHMLAYWTRDRATGRLPLAAAVRMLSDEPARAVGLADRGRIAPGYRGDLNVIDYDRLQLRAPRIERDLPAGGARLTQAADGYVATVKGGEVTYRDGRPTGALPGRLIRGAQPAPS